MIRVVHRKPAPETERRYPLATKSGIAALALLLAANEHWRPLTRKQRAALRRGYRDTLAQLRDLDPTAVPADGLPIDLPALPADVHPATARSLVRRGLAAGGRLTALAVEVVQIADDDERPIHTVRPVGDLL